jgi:2,5-diketo-D-gluconate reductase B
MKAQKLFMSASQVNFMQKIALPRIGLGTWDNTDPVQCATSVSVALSIGYRFIDTAQLYKNEEYVGNGIAQANVPREHIVVGTKVWVSNLSYDKVLKSTEESLRKLNLDTIDILYIHWPAGSYNPEETLHAFSELVDQGKVTHIAVSNFTVPLLEEALEICDKQIVANQVEMHPLLKQEEMVKFVQAHEMYLIAYCPLARGEVFDIPELIHIAHKHNVSEAQISLAWLMTYKNVIPIPKAARKAHIKENFSALQVALDREDIEKIESIRTEKRIVNLEFAPW